MQKKMGRPLKEIDRTQFEKLCGMFCKKREIWSFFDVSEDTLEKWIKRNYDGRTFTEVYEEKSDLGRISLRRAQFQKAMDGNVPLLIWMGKQHLGQMDHNHIIEETNKGSDVKIYVTKWGDTTEVTDGTDT